MRFTNYAAINSGNKDETININSTTDSTLNEHIQSIGVNDIYLNPITQTGGVVSIALSNGVFTQTGASLVTLLDGYMHLNIQNNTPKNLHTSSIQMGEKTNGSFTVNGAAQAFNPTGYGSGKINITSVGNINISDAITPATLTGELSLQSSGNIFVNSQNDLTLSKITANDVWLQTQGNMIDLGQNNPTISANNLRLNAVNNIGDDTHPLSITSNLLSAQSQTGNINIVSNNNINIDLIQTPNRITLTSQNGAITQNGDSADDIISNELLIQAKNGIGDNGVYENYLDTKVNVIDAKNSSANDIAIKNSQSLHANDLNFDGSALYNGGGDIKFIVNGDFKQQRNTTIKSARDVSIYADNNIFIENLQAYRDILLNSKNGNILGDSLVSPNLSNGRKTTLIAQNGVVGTPANIINIYEGTQGVHVSTKDAQDFLSVYIRGVVSPVNFHTDPELATFNNRPISGSKIDHYLRSIFYNSNQKHNNIRHFFFEPIKPEKRPQKLVNLN